MNIVSINLHLSTSPDKLREQIHSVIMARKEITLTVEGRDNLDSVIDILDDMLEKCINAESKRGK